MPATKKKVDPAASARAKKAHILIAQRRASGYYANRPAGTKSKPVVEEKPMPKGADKPIRLPEPKPATIADMVNQTVVLTLTISGIGNRRKVNTSQVEVNADKEWIGVTKKLLDADELEEISSLDGEARRWIESKALPSPIKRGVYLMPTVFVEEASDYLKAYVAKREPLVEKLGSKLPEYIREAQKHHKGLFNEEDMPTKSDIQGAFQVAWRWLFVDSAKNLTKKMAEEEIKKAEAEWIETRETIQQLLRAQMKEFTDHLVDKLTESKPGDRKTFRDSSIQKFQDFLASFDPRNIGNDVQLKAIVDRARLLIGGVDPEVLRSGETTREYVRDGFEQIKKALDPMIVKKPKRTIILED